MDHISIHEKTEYLEILIYTIFEVRVYSNVLTEEYIHNMDGIETTL